MCTSVARFSHRFTYPSAGEQTRRGRRLRSATSMLAHGRPPQSPDGCTVQRPYAHSRVRSLALANPSETPPHPGGKCRAQSEVSWSPHRVQCLRPSTPSCLGAHLSSLSTQAATHPGLLSPQRFSSLTLQVRRSSPTPTDLSRRPHHLYEPFASPPSHAQKGLSGSGLYAIMICSRERAPPSPNAERRRLTSGNGAHASRFGLIRITRRADVYVCAACLRWSDRVWYSY